MLRTFPIIGVLFVTMLASAEARIVLPAKPRLEVELLDGSKLSGQAVEAEASLRITTSVGEVRVPLVQLARIQMLDDRTEAILHFSNGNQLKGTVPPGIEVQTVLGRMTIPWAKIRSLRVLPAVSKRLQPEGVRISATWRYLPPENAVD